MAATRRAGDSLVSESEIEKRLWSAPFDFDFFQAVRLLQRMDAGRQPVGHFVNPEKEAVHFGACPSIAFPASQLESLEKREAKPPKEQDPPPLMMVNFMGLTGPLGVLPLHYTEMVVQRMLAKDPSLREFFDLFNHRLIALFYRAWEKTRFWVAYERGERDPCTQYTLDLIGLGTAGLQNRQTVSDESLLFYCGLLAQHPRSSSALRQMLIDYFEVPVEIEQFVGAWRRLEPESQCSMEGAGPTGKLGVGAVLGDEVWDPQSVVRIRLGPLSIGQYLDFLPNGSAFEPLRSLTRFFAAELDFEVQLILKRSDAPRCELGVEGETAPQLGWLTWMKNAPLERDPGDTILPLWKAT